MAGGRSLRTQAIVLGHTKLAESDLILTALAVDGTQLRCVAKGARKPGGRLASRTQLFCETDLLVSRGRSLGIVSEAQLVCAHARLAGDLSRVSAASVVAEVARLTCFEGAPDPFLYPVCARALLACEQARDQPHLDVAVAAYVMKVLSHQGWRPQLDACVLCGDADVSRVSAAAGGAVCESCARELAGAERVDAAELAWMRALIGLTFDELLAAPVEPGMASYLLASSHRWAATHLDARLRAFEFLLGA